jgi:hypothetical protein
MTDTPTYPPLFGQQLGAAAAASRAAIDAFLAGEGTTFLHWAVLHSLSTGGAAPLDDGAVADLVAAGLVTRPAGGGLALTPAGADRYRTLRSGVEALSASLLAGVPADDLATTRRVLLTMVQRHQAGAA